MTERDLLRTIRLRGDDDLVSRSVVNPAGSHLDALIGALLARTRGTVEAKRYLDLCIPWEDALLQRARTEH